MVDISNMLYMVFIINASAEYAGQSIQKQIYYGEEYRFAGHYRDRSVPSLRLYVSLKENACNDL